MSWAGVDVCLAHSVAYIRTTVCVCVGVPAPLRKDAGMNHGRTQFNQMDLYVLYTYKYIYRRGHWTGTPVVGGVGPVASLSRSAQRTSALDTQTHTVAYALCIRVPNSIQSMVGLTTRRQRARMFVCHYTTEI